MQQFTQRMVHTFKIRSIEFTKLTNIINVIPDIKTKKSF